MTIDSADRFTPTSDPCRQPGGLGDDPLIDLVNEAVFLGRAQEGSGRNHLIVLAQHPEEQLLGRPASLQRDNGLRVQDQPVIVQGIPNAPDPGQRCHSA